MRGTNPSPDASSMQAMAMVDTRNGTELRMRDRITSQEWRRKLLHLVPALVFYVCHFWPHADPIEDWSLWAVTGMCVFGAAGSLGFKCMFCRAGEQDWAMAVLSYLAMVLLLVWLFPDRTEITGAVISIIAFGDGLANFVGTLVGGQRLPWNPAKTWSGSAAFVVGALPSSVLAFWLEALPAVTVGTAFACTAPAVVLGAIAESLPMRINDNLRVGFVAATAIVVTQALLG